MSGLINNNFLGISGTSTPGVNEETAAALSKDVSKDIEKKNNSGMWGSIVNGVTGLVGSFNYKAQENQIALAQANADASRAQADATANQGNKKYLMIAVAIVVVIVLVVLLKPKNN